VREPAGPRRLRSTVRTSSTGGAAHRSLGKVAAAINDNQGPGRDRLLHPPQRGGRADRRAQARGLRGCAHRADDDERRANQEAFVNERADIVVAKVAFGMA